MNIKAKLNRAPERLLRATQKLRFRFQSRPGTLLTTYPPFRSADALADFQNRLAWYLGGWEGKIVVNIASDLALGEGKSPNEAQHAYLPSGYQLSFETHLDGTADEVLITQAGAADILSSLRNGWIVDPEYSAGVESTGWLLLRWHLLGPEGRGLHRKRSIELFQALETTLTHDSASLFATGPSIARALDSEYPDDSLRIICNSIVKDDELLARVRPQLLTFSDGVFHFGPSRYAHAFREHAEKVTRTFGTSWIVPDFVRPLLTAHYPHLEAKIIGIPVITGSPWNFPTSSNFFVRRTNNILTQFMIPLASAFSREISIFGADGRKKEETYYWKHSPRTQFTTEMESARKTHPSFFRGTSYVDYYDEHCRLMSSIFEFGERQGRHYHGATASGIPALAARGAPPL